MFSASITQTITPEAHLTHQETPLEKIRGLIAEMKKSPLFSGDVSHIILQFEQRIARYPNTSEKSQSLSIDLCYLICDIFPNLLNRESNGDNKKILIDFTSDLIGVLEETLPIGCDVSSFIDSYQSFSKMHDEVNTFKSQVQRIRTCFDVLVKGIYARANQITSQNIVLQFNALKEEAKKFNEQRTSRAKELHEKLAPQIAKIEEIGNQLEKIGNESHSWSERAVTEDTHLKQLLEDFEKVIQGLEL